MKILSKLGLGPMSTEIIDIVSDFAKIHKKNIMFIATRNQIDKKEFGGGYVNNFSTEEFSKYVKKKNNRYIHLCRDHAGPFLKDNEKDIKFEESLEKTKESLESDILNDFKLIHIDTSMCKNKYKIADELISFCNSIASKNKKKIFFEFGTEEHGTKVAVKKFENDAAYFSQIKNRMFLVGQTGSLIKEIYQVGEFENEIAKKLVKLSKKYNVYLKEHNCDYLYEDQIAERKQIGIGAINIAPELGYNQTKTLFFLANKFKIKKNLYNFKKLIIEKKKWKKWVYSENINNSNKILCAGHYHFSSYEYKQLIKDINKYVNFNKFLRESLFKNMEKFLKF
jgi:tagatose-1,6-bisphosphate aldolase non-catalytic subunit AgaZ/GatZ